MCVSSQCIKRFHIVLLVCAPRSPRGLAGQTALPHFTEEETKARWIAAWQTVPQSGVVGPGAESSPLSCSLQCKGLRCQGQKRSRGEVICATQPWPRPDGWWRGRGGARDLELRNAVQPPLGWPSEEHAPLLLLVPTLLQVAVAATWGPIPVLPCLHNNVNILSITELTFLNGKF